MSKSYDNFIKENDDSIKKLIEKFEIFKVNNKKIGVVKAKNRILRWLKNFDNIGFTDFNLLIEFLNKIEFLESRDIQDCIVSISDEIIDEKSYISPLGEISESSYMLSSVFHRENNYYNSIQELLSNISSEEEKPKIILIDDFLNSGGQLITIFYSLLGKDLPIGETNDEGDLRTKLNPSHIEKLKKAKIHLFFYKAFTEGVNKVRERLIKELGLDIEISNYTTANFNQGAFGDLEDQTRILGGYSGDIKMDCAFQGKSYVSLTDFYKILKTTGKELLRVNKPNWISKKYEERSLGYGNLCRMTVTETNVPTSTFTSIWLSGKIKFEDSIIDWQELFPRRPKVLPHKSKEEVVKKSKTVDLSTTYSSLHDFFVNFYLKSNLVAKEYFDDTTVNYYSEFFKPIVKFKTLEIEQNIEDGNLFDNLSQHVIKSESENPLIISGFSGCGKSTFLSVLYLYFKKQYDRGEIKKIPIYINLHKYNKEVYTNPTEKFQNQAIDKLNFDLRLLFNLINDENNEFVFIIDGTDQYKHSKVDLEDYLYEKLKKLNTRTKIIGVRQYKDEDVRTYKKENPIPFIDDPEIDLELTKVNIAENDFKIMIDSFTKIEALIYKQSAKEIKDYLLSKIKQYKIEEIDVFILDILMNGFRSYKYNNCKTLSRFYNSYFNEKSIDIIRSAELAFTLYNTPSKVNSDAKNNLYWWNLLRHKSFLNFFVAKHIVNQLTDSTEKEIKHFDYVYPFEINKFCKEIINFNIDYQRKCYEKIVTVFDDLSITSKTHFAYLLGRFDNDNIKTKAIKFLYEKKKSLEEDIDNNLFTNSFLKLNQEDKQVLLYHRTLFISLTYLGEKKVSSEYIEILVTNNYHDNLNRGFHLEYYNDIVIDSSSPESLKNEDNLGDFTKTFNKLYSRLIKAVENSQPYSMFQIEIYTLCSLSQHRHIINKLDSTKRESILLLIKKTIKNYFELDGNKNKELFKYLSFVKRIISNKDNIKVGSFLRDLYQIKETERTGWKNREIPNFEMVSSHMYGAFLMAYFYLPSTNPENEEYDKNIILRIILLHDVAEAYTGDIVKKTDEEKKIEKDHFTFLSFLGTFNGIANVRELENFYDQFENATTINGRIAKEIDKLELLFQLLLYNERYPNIIEDFGKMKGDCISSVNTDEGIRIKNTILEMF